MTTESLIYVFQVIYSDGRKPAFVRVESADECRDFAWKLVASRTIGLNHVLSIEFLHIERKY